MVSLFKKTDDSLKGEGAKSSVSKKTDASDALTSAGSKTGDSRKKPGKRSTVKKVSALLAAPAQIMGPRLLFILSVVVLCAIGLVMVYSASSIMALNSNDLGNDPAYYLKRQAFFMVAGVIACVILAAVPYRFWAKKPVFITIWVLTVLLLVATSAGLGITTLGAERSIYIAGFALQPSEFAKVAILLTFASLFEMQRETPMSPLRFGAVAVVCVAVPLYLIYKQPDLGTAIILLVGVLALMFLVGVSSKIIFGFVLLCVLYVAVVCIAQPYHLDRITSMLNPWLDPQGKGFQSIQSLYALGSGGIFGTGLGLSRQKYLYLPYAHTDFIFAIIGEELGLIGTVCVVLLFAAFILAGLRIARSAPDILGASLAGSLTVMIGFQACVNMACVIGIAPVTGKALPFISYGGSSILATMVAVGFVLSVSMRSSLDAVYEQRRDNLFVINGGKKDERAQGAASESRPAAALRVISGFKDKASQSASEARGKSSRGTKAASSARASSSRSSSSSSRAAQSSRKKTIYDTGHSRSTAGRSSAVRSTHAAPSSSNTRTSSATRSSRPASSSKRSGYSASLRADESKNRTSSSRAPRTSSSRSSSSSSKQSNARSASSTRRSTSSTQTSASEHKGRIKYPSRSRSSSSSQQRRSNRPGTRR